MPAYQPSILQHGEDLPLFADTLRSTRCSDCGSYLIALGTEWERCTECEREQDQEPPVTWTEIERKAHKRRIDAINERDKGD